MMVWLLIVTFLWPDGQPTVIHRLPSQEQCYDYLDGYRDGEDGEVVGVCVGVRDDA